MSKRKKKTIVVDSLSKKKIHKGFWLGKRIIGFYYVSLCYGKAGAFPELRADWKKVTCKRCLNKRNKNG